MAKPENMVVIISDQHARTFTGCYGHPIVKTPNIDALAADGVLFQNAYCNSPLCVPSRASVATGRYVHDHECWDNSRPYTGKPDSWGHRLNEHGYRATSIGKLHFRSTEDDNGFAEEILPMHVVDGIGMVATIYRDPPVVLSAGLRGVREAGPVQEGVDDSYVEYDRKITQATLDWLSQKADADDDKPWALFVSLVCPHPPYVCPPEYYEMYKPLGRALLPTDYDPDKRPMHPAIEDLRYAMSIPGDCDEEALINVVASYFGAISYLDDNIGKIVSAIRALNGGDRTRILYCSDHGENIGNKALFGKCNMYEESAGVPLILTGSDLPSGARCQTNASLVDIFPTVVEAVGCAPDVRDSDLPGTSLFQIANSEFDPDRVVFSEHHSGGAKSAIYMIRTGKWKYVYYVGYEPQLFDLESDPDERTSLHGSEEHRRIEERCHLILLSIVDPEKVDARAKKDQKARLAALGDAAQVRAKQYSQYSATPVPDFAEQSGVRARKE